MRLNDDLDQRVVLHTATMPWVPSPMAGVERRMLDRVGDEVARATSIVRYAALAQRYQLSIYDALIVAAAQQSDCGTLYSEDLQHGMRFGSLQVRNPFR